MSGPLNGLAARIAWGDASTVAPPPMPEIIRPGLGEELEIVLLDAQAVSVWLHWTGKRSVPHLVGQEPCPHCLATNPAKQYGFLTAWYLRRNRVGVAELTAHALSRCPEALQPSQARPLRGRHALLSRSPGHRSARCLLRLLDAVHAGPLPPPLNVRSVLEHLWGWDPATRAALGLDGPPQSNGEEAPGAD